MDCGAADDGRLAQESRNVPLVAVIQAWAAGKSAGRRSCGRNLIINGPTPYGLAMRHSDLKLTMKTYMDAKQLAGPVGAAVKLLPWNQPLLKVAENEIKITA